MIQPDLVKAALSQADVIAYDILMTEARRRAADEPQKQ